MLRRLNLHLLLLSCRAALNALHQSFPLPLQPHLIHLHAHNQRALPADLISVLVENKRDRDDGHFEQSQQRPRPVGPDPRVHIRAHQGQHTAQDTPNDRVTRHGRRGVHPVTLREVVGRIYEDARVAGAEEDACKDGDDPVDGRRGAGPGEPELAGWNEDGRDAHDGHHGFGGHLARFWVDFVAVDHPADQRFAGDGGEAASADSGKGESGEAQGPAPDLTEDDRISGETEVENAVHDGDVNVPEDTANVSRGNESVCTG